MAINARRPKTDTKSAMVTGTSIRSAVDMGYLRSGVSCPPARTHLAGIVLVKPDMT